MGLRSAQLNDFDRCISVLQDFHSVLLF